MAGIESAADIFNGTQAVTTSYYNLGGDAAIVQHVTISWDTAVIGTITFWSTDFPEVALDSTDARHWAQENPASGYTAISPSGAATVGSNPLVIVIPGGTAGIASVNLGNSGTLRQRARVVCTGAGSFRIRTNGKP
jgi:hypothetical protein